MSDWSKEFDEEFKIEIERVFGVGPTQKLKSFIESLLQQKDKEIEQKVAEAQRATTIILPNPPEEMVKTLSQDLLTILGMADTHGSAMFTVRTASGVKTYYIEDQSLTTDTKKEDK